MHYFIYAFLPDGNAAFCFKFLCMEILQGVGLPGCRIPFLVFALMKSWEEGNLPAHLFSDTCTERCLGTGGIHEVKNCLGDLDSNPDPMPASACSLSHARPPQSGPDQGALSQWAHPLGGSVAPSSGIRVCSSFCSSVHVTWHLAKASAESVPGEGERKSFNCSLERGTADHCPVLTVG